jgi:hypothetical protein
MDDSPDLGHDANLALYQSAVRTSLMCAGIVGQFDIPALLEAIERADAMGPLFDPTLWISNHGKMEEDREVLKAALPLWRLCQKLKQLREQQVPVASPAPPG